MSTQESSLLPQTIDTLTTDELKVRFQTRTIPLESDFAALIDVAECGRRAVGVNPEQTPNPSSGLVMDAGGQLVVLPAPVKGIAVDSSGVGVVVNAASGMQVDASGVGINTTSSNGLIAAGNQLKVALSASNPGLELTTDGLRLKPNGGAGIVVDGDGIGLDASQQFIPGMIMMFSGTTVPLGWALCDGNNGTPNLMNRFILAGNLNEKGMSGGAPVSGVGASKSYTVSSNGVGAGNIAVTVNGTTLTTAQIPSHNHLGGTRYGNYSDDAGTDHYGYYTGTGAPNSVDILRHNPNGYWLFYTSTAGGGQSHSHTATATQGSHSHTINTLPSYYILAFIMKL